MLIPLIISLIYNESRYFFPFIVSAVISAFIGIFLVKLFKVEIEMTLKIAMIFSTIIWIIACALAALPYYLSGELSYLNAYFEAMSGFTTQDSVCIQIWTLFLIPSISGVLSPSGLEG
jgi:trk system potassium uptake protein TrkH